MRVGYAWDHWLFYTKAGVAGSHNKYTLLDIGTFTFSPPPFTSISALLATGADTRIGWTVGLGAEWAVWNNWSVFVEYDYLDFGNSPVLMSGASASLTFVGPSTPFQGAFGIEQKVQTAKFGFNYRFERPSEAVSARY